MKINKKIGYVFCAITSALLIVIGFVMYFKTSPVVNGIFITICSDVCGCVLGGITVRIFVKSVDAMRETRSSFSLLDVLVLGTTLVIFILFDSYAFTKRVCFIFPMASLTSFFVELFDKYREKLDEKIEKTGHPFCKN